jgi:murein L,D-transpeptidase YafK
VIGLAVALALSALPTADAQDAEAKVSRYERRPEKGDFSAGSPLFIRVFKEESQLELWMEKAGRFELLDTLPICHWSGTLGPKLYEGDRQAPEGFYSIGPQQLILTGRHVRSLDLGYPNAFDRSLERTGSHILLHGGCGSTGCFAMTDPPMDRIYALAEQALHAGQQEIPVHVFPFRMTNANLEKHAHSPWRAFWSNLKVGYDAFEATRTLPVVYACRSSYLVESDDPTLQANPPTDCAVHTPLMAEAKPSQRIARAPLRPATMQKSAGLPRALTAYARPGATSITYPRDNVAECNRLWKPSTGTARQDWMAICKRLDFQQKSANRLARRPS